jgi:hypothetical protein
MKNRNLFFYAALLLMSATGIRCSSKCGTTDCGNLILPGFSFRLVNSQGRDLIGSPVKIYDSANVKVLGKRAATGAVESIRRVYQVVRDTTYIAGFSVSKDYSVYYVSINNNITDSLAFGFNNRQTECCDNSYFSLNKVNNSDISPPLALPQNGYPIVK